VITNPAPLEVVNQLKVPLVSEREKKLFLITGLKNRNSFLKLPLLELSVIIVNYNVKYFLEQCLCSVERACNGIKAEVIVVDNYSTDNSRQFFEHRFKKVIFHWNEMNTGFSRANNQALAMATGEYILFLNPDTILPEDCLEKCLAFIRQQPSGGALGVRMIDGSGQYLKESKRGFPTPLASLFKLSGISHLFPRSKFFAPYYLGHLDAAAIQRVDVLAGAFMLVRKKVLDITGGFDERFFMYGEDIDLSYRIQMAGFTNYYFPSTTIIHFKGESSQRNSRQYITHFYGAMGLFVKKHHPGLAATFYTGMIKLAIGLRSSWRGIGTQPKKQPHHQIPGTTMVIASERAFESVKNLVSKNNLKLELQRIAPDQISNPDKLLSAIGTSKKLAAKELIFCINGFSAASTIACLQQVPGKVACRFHFEGCKSMVGSNDSGSTGDYIY